MDAVIDINKTTVIQRDKNLDGYIDEIETVVIDGNNKITHRKELGNYTNGGGSWTREAIEINSINDNGEYVRSAWHTPAAIASPPVDMCIGVFILSLK